MHRIIGICGLLVFVACAIGLSEDRKRINWHLVGWGMLLQIVFALVILKTGVGLAFFKAANVVMTSLVNFTEIGASFLFGSLAKDTKIGALVAFRMLPVVIFVGSLMAVLWYFRIIQGIVYVLAWIMKRTMRASGVETFITGLFVFMGIEAITAVKAYFERMTRSELFTLMTAFMSTIAGSVMAIYVGFGAEAGHLLAASVMSAPGAIALAKIIVPEKEDIKDVCDERIAADVLFDNPIEAAADGAVEGLKLALNIGAMLIAFISLIALFNFPLSYVHLSFERILGWIATPFALLMGVPLHESVAVGELIGIKTVLNEFIAFMKMGEMAGSGLLSHRSLVIATYALCGFANFGSLAILIGGAGSIAPSRKKEIVSLGIKALIAGTLVKFITATIAGILI